jgi:hypothetical protein
LPSRDRDVGADPCRLAYGQCERFLH